MDYEIEFILDKFFVEMVALLTPYCRVIAGVLEGQGATLARRVHPTADTI